jgi:DnaJ-class molecular chaperone
MPTAFKPCPVTFCSRCEEPTTILSARCGKPSCIKASALTALADSDWKLCSTCQGQGDVGAMKCVMCKGHGWLLIRSGTLSATQGRNL